VKEQGCSSYSAVILVCNEILAAETYKQLANRFFIQHAVCCFWSASNESICLFGGVCYPQIQKYISCIKLKEKRDLKKNLNSVEQLDYVSDDCIDGLSIFS
jgi:hypothetical protein